MLSYIIIAGIAYLLGNISTSYIIAKRIAGVDIRTQGSGNAGSTNAMRTFGKKVGAMTFAGDVLKGTASVLIAGILTEIMNADVMIGEYVAVIAVVAGHNWPVFLGFRGGKGVATSLGAMLAINPMAAIICLGVFIVIVACTKYVSLGSVVGISCSPFIMLYTKNMPGLVVTLFLSVSVIYTHRANIKRLISGTESKLGDRKKK